MRKTRYPRLVSYLVSAAVFIGLILSFQGISHVQADAIFAPLKAWPHENTDLKPDPNVVYGRLPNGFGYVLMKNKKPENRVSMHLDVQAGSMYESEDERGIAHFLEHLLFCGSEHFKPGELVKYFQKIGMKFGADANAQTGFYNTVYDIDLPGGDPKSLKKGLTVIRDYAAGALIPAAEVDRERSVVLAEKRTRDSADYRTFVRSFNFELPDALLPNRLPIGLEPVLQHADRRLLKSFYDAWYRPKRMTIVMVGDFDIDTAKSEIKSDFSNISPRAPEKGFQDPGKIKHSGVETFYHFEPEAGNTTVSIEVVTKRINPPDSAALKRRELLSSMANRIVNHRLSEMLNKPGTPFTSASISSGNYLKYLQAAEISADCAPGKWEETLSIIEQTLRKALMYGFTRSEIDQVKKELMAGLDRAVKAAPTRESRHLARQIIGDLNRDRVFQSPRQRKALLAPFIEATSQKDLHGALVKDWAPEHRLILVTGNTDLKNSNGAPEKQILNAYAKSIQTPVEKPKEEAAVKFPYLTAPDRKGKIRSRKTIPDLGIVRVEFENGLVLNIKKTDFKANQVVARLAFGYGRSGEPEKKPGLAQLSQSVINLSGLGRLTRDELARALAGKNAHVSFQVEQDQFVLAGSTVTDETPLMFQLLYAYLNDTGFRGDAYQLAIRRFMEQYESLSHAIEGGMALKGSRFLAGGDTRFGVVDPAAFAANSLDDVRKWIGSYIQTAPMEVSVVGDLEVEAIIDEAAVFFGALPLKQAQEIPDRSRQPSFPAGKSLLIHVPTKIHKGVVDVAYPTGDAWDIRRNRRLSVLSEIITDRMRIKIRQKMGAAYSYYAYNSPSRAYPGYGTLHAVVQNNPDQAETVIKTVQQIAGDIAKNGVTPDELNRAIKPILTSIKERVKTNGYWLNSVLKGSGRHPEQLDWSRTFEKDYAAITVDEVSALAKTYLKNPAAATVIVKPEQGAGSSPSGDRIGYGYPAGERGSRSRPALRNQRLQSRGGF